MPKVIVKCWDWILKVVEDANGVPDEARIGALCLIATFCYNSYTAVVLSATHTFDPQTFGIGAGALAAGLGAWLGLRKDN
jgi:hypothetical protein